jgi:hypothetical protein
MVCAMSTVRCASRTAFAGYVVWPMEIADCADLRIVPMSSPVALRYRGFEHRDVGTIRGSGSLAADAQYEVVERIQAAHVSVPDEAIRT